MNPWHGCVRCSEGCQHCYMYFLDRVRDKNGADIYRTKAGFTYPLQKKRDGSYKVKSGKLICAFTLDNNPCKEYNNPCKDYYTV